MTYNDIQYTITYNAKWDTMIYNITMNTMRNEIQWATIYNEYNAKWGAMGYNIQWATMNNGIQWHTMTTMSPCLIVAYLIVLQWVQWLQHCSSFLQHYTSLLQHYSMHEFSDVHANLKSKCKCLDERQWNFWQSATKRPTLTPTMVKQPFWLLFGSTVQQGIH